MGFKDDGKLKHILSIGVSPKYPHPERKEERSNTKKEECRLG